MIDNNSGLLFVVNNDYWHITPTGDADTDSALGRCFAESLFRELLNPNPTVLSLLEWISASQASYKGNDDQFVRQAFWQHVSFAVRSYARKAFTQPTD